MWQTVETDAELDNYAAVLRTTLPDYFSNVSLKSLKRLKDHKKGVFALWDDGQFTICVGLIEKPDLGAWKLVYCNPGGNYQPEAAMKVAFAKVRQLVDSLGVTQFYAVSAKDYVIPKMNAFRSLAERKMGGLIWESEDAGFIANSIILNFKRTSDRRNEDADWKGPVVS